MPAAAPSPSASLSPRDGAVAWMNLGYELMLRGDRENLSAALDAYNEAVARLRPLAAGPVHPSIANSLGAALMNRGHLLHRLHGTAQATVALESFDEAARLLAPFTHGENPWPRRNFAGTLLNRAHLLLDAAQPAPARTAAAAALALAVPHEFADTIDADLALKARRSLCDALGRLIIAPGADQEAIACEASDLVDEALALARHWTARGAAQPRELAVRLFRFGAQLYRLHQPQFLAEFLAENLPQADAEIRAIALEAIDQELSAGRHTILTIGDPSSKRRLAAWRELEELRPRFAS